MADLRAAIHCRITNCNRCAVAASADFSVRAEPSRRVAFDYPLPFEIVTGATGPVQLAKHGEFSLLPN